MSQLARCEFHSHRKVLRRSPRSVSGENAEDATAIEKKMRHRRSQHSSSDVTVNLYQTGFNRKFVKTSRFNAPSSLEGANPDGVHPTPTARQRPSCAIISPISRISTANVLITAPTFLGGSRTPPAHVAIQNGSSLPYGTVRRHPPLIEPGQRREAIKN